MISNDYLDAAVAAFFLLRSSSSSPTVARVWWGIASGDAVRLCRRRCRSRAAYSVGGGLKPTGRCPVGSCTSGPCTSLARHLRPLAGTRRLARVPRLSIRASLGPVSARARAPHPVRSTSRSRTSCAAPSSTAAPAADVRWSADGKWIYFQLERARHRLARAAAPYRVRATGGAKPERLTLAQADSALPYVTEGDACARRDGACRRVPRRPLSRATDRTARRAVSRRPSPTRRARPSPPTARRIFFVRDDNVFSMSLDGGRGPSAHRHPRRT